MGSIGLGGLDFFDRLLHNGGWFRLVSNFEVIDMASISSIALSGMTAAQTQLNSAAHNIANLGTQGFVRQETAQQAQAQGGVSASVRPASAPGDSLVSDVVTLLQAKNAFIANLAVFKTQDKMAGALFDQTV